MKPNEIAIVVNEQTECLTTLGIVLRKPDKY